MRTAGPATAPASSYRCTLICWVPASEVGHATTVCPLASLANEGPPCPAPVVPTLNVPVHSTACAGAGAAGMPPADGDGALGAVGGAAGAAGAEGPEAMGATAGAPPADAPVFPDTPGTPEGTGAAAVTSPPPPPPPQALSQTDVNATSASRFLPAQLIFLCMPCSTAGEPLAGSAMLSGACHSCRVGFGSHAVGRICCYRKMRRGSAGTPTFVSVMHPKRLGLRMEARVQL